MSRNTGGLKHNPRLRHFRRIGQAGLFRIGTNLFRQFFAAFRPADALARNHVDPVPGRHFQNPESRLRRRRAEFQHDHALLRVDQGEAGVRAEPDVRNLFMFSVIFHVFPAAFLVAAENQPDALFQGDSRVPDRLHGIQCRQRRSLVVVGSPAVDPSVFNQSVKGRLRPSVPHRHHVQVTQHRDLFLRVPQRRVAGVSLEIPYRKTHGPDVRHGPVQHLPHVLSEGRAVLRLSLHRRRPDPSLQSHHKFIPVTVNQFINFLLHPCFLPKSCTLSVCYTLYTMH